MAEHRPPSLWLWAAAGSVLAFLHLPLLIVALYSFNASRLGSRWAGFTLDWYHALFADHPLMLAAWNSLVIALAAASISAVIGTLAGFALHRYRPRLLNLLVITPLAVPDILTGVSLLMFFVMLGITLGKVSIILAHVSFCVSYVAIVVRASLAGLDPHLIEAARDLGCTPAQAFLKVVLPLILPGVLAGALLAFTLSIDDFVITFFTSGAGVSTLPLEIYSMLKVTITPKINAISTLLMILTLVVVLAVGRLAPALWGRT